MKQIVDNLDFTGIALDSMYDTVDDIYFRDKDAELIYRTLECRLKTIPFCNYLKRYIYNRAELTGNYAEIPLKDYQLVIHEAFSENHTPPSFRQVSSKLSALSKNWLTQQTVKREVIFLLGFGLHMPVEDVNKFLTVVLREQGINFKNPFEIICWYCYKNGYNYLKFEKLWQAYQETPANSVNVGTIYSEYTIGYRRTANSIHDDLTLLAHLSKLKTDDLTSKMSVTSWTYFEKLYNKARDIVAGMYNSSEEEKNLIKVQHYIEQLNNNDCLYDYDKQRRIQKKRHERYVFSRDDIGPGDIERVICSAIPLDGHGNLVPISESKLNEHFNGKKLSRQRLSDILAHSTQIERFDLITLNFFIYSQQIDDYPERKNRYLRFVDSTNEILGYCCMGDLYVTNPYECFILMCILSDDPLGTYADVWEKSFDMD